jgi:hypothetical protein
MHGTRSLTPPLSHPTGVTTWPATPPGMKTPGRTLTLPSPVRRERVAEGRVRGILTVESARRAGEGRAWCIPPSRQ